MSEGDLIYPLPMNQKLTSADNIYEKPPDSNENITIF
jgi:hypothetical protein